MPLNEIRNFDFVKEPSVVITGWGLTEKGSFSPVLRQTILSVIDLDICKNFYQTARNSYCSNNNGRLLTNKNKSFKNQIYVLLQILSFVKEDMNLLIVIFVQLVKKEILVKVIVEDLFNLLLRFKAVQNIINMELYHLEFQLVTIQKYPALTHGWLFT